MKERIEKTTPKIITELFQFPYQWFSAYLLLENSGTKIDSILDMGCGENQQRPILEQLGKKVISMDIATIDTIVSGSLTNIPLEDKSVDYTFCFETIEHIPEKEQKKAMQELKRVSKKGIILGSVNTEGPNFICGVEIYKGKRNPFHLHELNMLDFIKLCDPIGTIQFFHSIHRQKTKDFVMKEGLTVRGFCNYGFIKV